MSAALRRRALALFMEVVQLPAIERAAALDARCAGEPELRAAVEELLRRDTEGVDDAFAEGRVGGLLGLSLIHI